MGFFSHFWIILNEVPSENVVAMEIKKGLSFTFCLKHHQYILGVNHVKFQEKILLFQSYARKTTARGEEHWV